MADDTSIFIGASRKPDDSYQQPEQLLLKYGNRHGLVTGATGTGKTVTLQILAEGFSNQGVPVFCADVKGDLSGIAMMGEAKDFLVARAEAVKLDPYEFQEFPVIFWDLFGEQGHPIRATVSEMGPLLLSRLMNLTEAQEGIINIAFTHRRRGGPAASRHEGSAGAARQHRRAAPTRSAPATATSPSRRSARSSATCWFSSSRAAPISSASRR